MTSNNAKQNNYPIYDAVPIDPSADTAWQNTPTSSAASSEYQRHYARQAGTSPSHPPFDEARRTREQRRSNAPSSGSSSRAAASPHSSSPNASRSQANDQQAAQEFERLCRVIGDSVSQATHAIGEGLKNSKEPLTEGLSSAGAAVSEALGKSYESYKQYQAKQQIKSEIQRQQALIKARFTSPSKLRAGGIVQTAFGGILSLSFVSAFLEALLSVGSTGAIPWVVGLIVIGVFSGLSIKLLASGINKIRLAKVMDAYKRIIGRREVIEVSELATRMGTAPKKTLGTIDEVIARGLLPEGRLDEERTTLMLTPEAYSQYLEFRKSQAEREHEELMRRQQEEAEARALGLTPEARQFLDMGRDYIEQMQELDEAIQDEAVSAKIVAIEEVVRRILLRGKDEPSVIDGLGRLMNYYLPTTVKLLTAYDALEEQTVQGENIISSRQEIEQTLDVLYVAYEKLLDATFEDLSMDVSSDISVLHTVLAQEGLVDGPFDGTTKN